MELITLGLAETRSSPLESPAVPLTSPAAWLFFMGDRDSDSGEVVSPHSAMQVATVNSCVRLLSEAVASATLVLSERTATGKIEALTNPLHRIMSLEPNPESSAFSLWSSFVGSILLTGNGYIEIQRNGLDAVAGLWFLHPDTVTPMRQPDGTLVYRCNQGLPGGQSRTLPARSVIHVPWYSTDGVTGVSVIAQARNAIGGALAAEKYAARFFANNATPSGILTTKARIKPEDKTRMRTEWEFQQQGARQHRIAVLDQELTFLPLTVNQADAQFLESRKFSREEICGLFGIKSSQIGDTARVAGETYSAMQLGFLTDTLNPWLVRIRQELTRKLLAGLPRYAIHHDVSARLKLDVKSQMDAFAVARQWGLMTANQCRKDLGLDPGGPECDSYWAPVNMVDASRLLSPPDPTTKSGVENV